MNWRPLLSYEGLYEVSDLGQVRSLHRWRDGQMARLLSPFFRNGYAHVALCKNGRQQNCKGHRLVARAFLGEPAPGEEVNHKDGQRLNNQAANLEWITHRANVQHCMNLGLWRPPSLCGEAHPNAKLTQEQVREIRSLRGRLRQVDIAKRYGIHQTTVSLVQLQRGWTHIGQ